MIPVIVPDLDIWLKAFSRQTPEPLVVHAFARQVTARRVMLIGPVRQELLTRVRDERQSARLAWLLSGFPDLRVQPDDHVRAAELSRQLRSQRLVIEPWPALLWTLAIRIQGRIWSQNRMWTPFVAHGCPVGAEVQ